MTIAVAVLLTVGTALIAHGLEIERAGRSANERSASAVPYIFGFALIAADLFMLAGWGLYQLLAS